MENSQQDVRQVDKSVSKKLLSLKQRDENSLRIIIGLITFEILVTCYLYCAHSLVEFRSSLVSITLCIGIIIALGVMIGLYIDARRNHYISGLSTVIITKLLGNAIAPRLLCTIYLFFFVIHLGWITNSTFDLISTDGSALTLRTIIPLIVALIGIYFLICFFPDTAVQKNAKPMKVFVSGLSLFSSFKNPVEAISIIPAVRILELTDDKDETCEMLILASSAFMKEDWLNGLKLPTEKLISSPEGSSKGEIKIKARIEAKTPKGINMLNTELENAICTFKNGKPVEIEKICQKYGLNKMKVIFEYGLENEKIDRLKLLALIIKIFAIFEFPSKKNLILNMKISFTKICSYDDYEECFSGLNAHVEKIDDEEHQLIFNLTPGTSMIGSVMTLLAIDSDRELYYYSQDGNETIEGSLRPVIKNRLPILDLMSKAMDKFTTGN